MKDYNKFDLQLIYSYSVIIFYSNAKLVSKEIFNQFAEIMHLSANKFIANFSLEIIHQNEQISKSISHFTPIT